MKQYVLFIIICFQIVLSGIAQNKTTYPFVERDSTLSLDVYRPAQPRADKACIVSLFGGGFCGSGSAARLRGDGSGA